MKVYKKTTNNKGFSLAELLIVIAILLVLFGLAAPAIISYQKKIDQKEADDTAKSIFLSVQNNLTGMKTAGTLNYATIYPEDDGKLTDSGYCYFDSDSTFDTGSTKYSGPLIPINMKSIEGVYRVIFDINSGDVKQVIYKIDPSKENGIVGHYPTDDEIGTDAGLSVSFGNTDPTFNPTVEAENNDNITIKVLVDHPTVQGHAYAFNTSYITYDLTLKNELGSLTFENNPISKTGNNASVININEFTFDIVIEDGSNDSYLQQFLNSISASAPNGEYQGFITATVDVTYNSDIDSLSIYTDAAANNNTVTFHSLFGNGTVANIIDISCRRHLQNLSEFNVDAGASYEVIQSADIDMSIRKNSAYNSNSFSPICNDLLFGNESTYTNTSYNGNGYKIIGLKINNSSSYPNIKSYAGLFAYANCTLTDISIVNPDIYCPSTYYVGALVGYMYGGKINHCCTYLEKLDGDRYAACAGGTSLTQDPGDYFTKHPTQSNVQGAKIVGGLLGKNKNTTIIGSFAAVNVYCNPNSADGYCGGFIGYNDSGCKISYCYSSGNASYANYLVRRYDARIAVTGGFVGYNASNGKIDHCYSSGSVITDLYGGGFVGDDNTRSSQIKYCYVYGYCMKRYPNDTEIGFDTSHPNMVSSFVPSYSDDYYECDDDYYKITAPEGKTLTSEPATYIDGEENYLGYFVSPYDSGLYTSDFYKKNYCYYIMSDRYDLYSYGFSPFGESRSQTSDMRISNYYNLNFAYSTPYLITGSGGEDVFPFALIRYTDNSTGKTVVLHHYGDWLKY